jgi:magnesium-transporting ATPase (P-type)
MDAPHTHMWFGEVPLRVKGFCFLLSQPNAAFVPNVEFDRRFNSIHNGTQEQQQQQQQQQQQNSNTGSQAPTATSLAHSSKQPSNNSPSEMPTRSLPLLPLRRGGGGGGKPGNAGATETGAGGPPAPSTGSGGGGSGGNATGGGGGDNCAASYTEHTLPLAELARRLELPYALGEAHGADSSGLPGLPREVVAVRRGRYGSNALTPPKGKTELRRFVEKFIDPFMILLELAAALSLALYLAKPHEQRSSLYVAVVLAAIIVLTCLLAYHQEGQSARVMGAFQGMMSQEAMVGLIDPHRSQHAVDASFSLSLRAHSRSVGRSIPHPQISLHTGDPRRRASEDPDGRGEHGHPDGRWS